VNDTGNTIQVISRTRLSLSQIMIIVDPKSHTKLDSLLGCLGKKVDSHKNTPLAKQ